MGAAASSRLGADRDSVAAGARLARLFAEHGRMVLGLCRVMLGDPHEAEDATQQTFLSAYRSLLAGVQPVDAAAWLAAIARNECRARTRKRNVVPLPLDGDLASPVPDVADVAGEREEVGEITAAIAALPPRQREALVLRYYADLSEAEIAESMGISRGAVKSHTARGIAALREHLGAGSMGGQS